MGIYPMLRDETCFLLAVDFDKEGWREDANAFWETCRYLSVPAALERSRSGNGAAGKIVSPNPGASRHSPLRPS